ncbi:MAG: molybdopterin converting factor subunit 1 [Alphaproteobacteria bacterium]|nr:molybdopterin converting factor subunit 1 [Alphaproteobacteria bacterium]
MDQNITILYFAWIKMELGKASEKIVLPPNVGDVASLAGHLSTKGSPYADIFAERDKIWVAVNQNRAEWGQPVHAGDEVAFFPPVTGG